jgi:hypothetical protein
VGSQPKMPIVASLVYGDDRGFLKEEVKTFQMAQMSPLNSPTIIFRL